MDLHFLLRNSISGGVFILSLMAGLWVGDAESLVNFMDLVNDYDLSTVLLASTLVIGILLQGVYLVGLYVIGFMFSDDARLWVSGTIKDLIRSTHAWPPSYTGNLSRYY